jgi:hypothetical protein
MLQVRSPVTDRGLQAMLGSHGKILIKKRTISGLPLRRPTEAGNSRPRMVGLSTRAPTVKIVIRPSAATVAFEATAHRENPAYFRPCQILGRNIFHYNDIVALRLIALVVVAVQLYQSQDDSLR